MLLMALMMRARTYADATFVIKWIVIGRISNNTAAANANANANANADADAAFVVDFGHVGGEATRRGIGAEAPRGTEGGCHGTIHNKIQEYNRI